MTTFIAWEQEIATTIAIATLKSNSKRDRATKKRAKKNTSNNFIRSNRENYNIVITLLEKWEI